MQKASTTPQAFIDPRVTTFTPSSGHPEAGRSVKVARIGNLVEWTNKKGVKRIGFTGCYSTSGKVTNPIGGWSGTTGGI